VKISGSKPKKSFASSATCIYIFVLSCFRDNKILSLRFLRLFAANYFSCFSFALPITFLCLPGYSKLRMKAIPIEQKAAQPIPQEAAIVATL
jgi:hypothetical protein